MTTGLYLVSYRERHVCACLYHIQSVVKVYRHDCSHKRNKKINFVTESSILTYQYKIVLIMFSILMYFLKNLRNHKYLDYEDLKTVIPVIIKPLIPLLLKR